MTAAQSAGPGTRAASTPIVVDGVSKVFGEDTDKPFEAVRSVSMDIAPGEFVSVVGPSGCGKSTLMLMIAGLLERSTGTITVGDATVDGPITDVGIAFQDHLLLDFRTAEKNVLLQAEIRGLDKARLKARSDELFEQLRLGQAKSRYPRQLSGGMRQRVSLIRTLVHDPSVILMDEPFGALDALTRLQVRTDLEALWLERRPTVVFITHSVEEAVGLSDRIFVMSPSPGEIVDEVVVELPRPRPIVLGESPEFFAYVDRIYKQFQRMGVLHGIDVPTTSGEA
ncbi:ABC transporter ATP-binding protein [Amycolatopsis sp. NPDC050768]|uniref:ABC transporter ATP-binding protein n=1 Tax=Amycolatopsis sp. NPDC050768 TaxID=3154839 RepID=UPI0033CC3491